jgi:hypothetical protein
LSVLQLGPNGGTQTADSAILISIERTSILFRQPRSCFGKLALVAALKRIDRRTPGLDRHLDLFYKIVADARHILPSGGIDGTATAECGTFQCRFLLIVRDVAYLIRLSLVRASLQSKRRAHCMKEY